MLIAAAKLSQRSIRSSGKAFRTLSKYCREDWFIFVAPLLWPDSTAKTSSWLCPSIVRNPSVDLELWADERDKLLFIGDEAKTERTKMISLCSKKSNIGTRSTGEERNSKSSELSWHPRSSIRRKKKTRINTKQHCRSNAFPRIINRLWREPLLCSSVTRITWEIAPTLFPQSIDEQHLRDTSVEHHTKARNYRQSTIMLPMLYSNPLMLKTFPRMSIFSLVR